MQDLNQQEYSDYIQRNLQQIFPSFSDCFRFEKDVYIVEYLSDKKILTLWISTQDCEITIGLDENRECVWHNHMSQFGAFEPETELNAVVKFINRILDGREFIVTNSKKQIFVTDSMEECLPNHELTYKIWSDF